MLLPLATSTLVLHKDEVLHEPSGTLDVLVRQHVAGEHASGLVVLGGFGAGKSTLCRELAAEEPANGRPCSFVPLAVVARAPSIAQGLIRVIGAPRLEEAREGRRVLLLDGLDEVPDPGSFPAWFEALTAQVGPCWVLTSRPGHFRTSVDSDPEQVDTLRTPQVRTVLIEPLERSTVQDVLGGLPGGQALLRTVEGLEELGTSPLLLQILHAALPHVEPGRPIDAWGIFDAWLRQAHRTGPDHDDVLDRLEEVAWDAFRDSGFSTEAMSFRTEQLSQARIPAALRRSLMVTELDGRIRFGHRSVFEYLLAARMAPRLASGQGSGPDELTGLRITDATRAFLVGRCGRMPVVTDQDRVRIPRGNFVAGGDRSPDERRLRIEHLADAVWVARAPVTGAAWSRYLTDRPDARVDAGYLPHWGADRRLPPGHGDVPIHGVWPEDADRFATWSEARLTTADEWEKAARGIDGRTWPWGDHWRPGLAVTAELGVRNPLPVRAFGAHGDAGLFAACGSVFEITASPYRGLPARGRVVMGGCYTHPYPTARPSLRLSHTLSGNLKTGLRLAWSAP